MPYGLPEALQEVAEAKEGYVAAVGVLTFDETKLPKVDWDRQDNTPPVTNISARIVGKSLTKKGFSNPLTTRLTLEVNCFGPWCASAHSDKNVLVFLQQTSNGYTLSTTPCGGHIFENPTRKDMKSVERCYLNDDCPKSQNR